MKRWTSLLAVLLVICFLGGCAVENRLIAVKTWDAQPSNFAVVGEVNTQHADAKQFKDFLVKDIEIWMKLYKHKLSDQPDIRLTVTIDKLEPGNRWVRWISMGFAGQGHCLGKVFVRKGGSLVGEYEYGGLQRGGTFFGGTLKDMSNDVALGIARKITKQKFNDKMYEFK